jgi:hypothetical protein
MLKMSPKNNHAVGAYLLEHSKYPLVAVRLLAKC